MNDPVSCETLACMRRFGGSFVFHLSEAYVRADLDNRDRLLKAFPELFRFYKDFSKAMKEKHDASVKQEDRGEDCDR
mgnify:CR=1 FL=1